MDEKQRDDEFCISQDSKGLFIIISNGKSNIDDFDMDDLSSEYEVAMRNIKETFQLNGANCRRVIGVNLVPDTPQAPDPTEKEPEKNVYEGISYERFIEIVGKHIEQSPPSFLITFLLSHGTQRDEFTLTGLSEESSENLCCNDHHDSLYMGLCQECHLGELCKCNCPTKCRQRLAEGLHTGPFRHQCTCKVDKEQHLVCSKCVEKPDPKLSQEAMACAKCKLHKLMEKQCQCQLNSQHTKEAENPKICKETRIHSSTQNCICFCHQLCSCYAHERELKQKQDPTSCGVHDVHACYCRCHREHASIGSCHLRSIERDLIRNEVIQKHLQGVPKMFFIQTCRANSVKRSHGSEDTDENKKKEKTAPLALGGSKKFMRPYDTDTLILYACHPGTVAHPDHFIEDICSEWKKVGEIVKQSYAMYGEQKSTEYLTRKTELSALINPGYRHNIGIWLTDLCHNVINTTSKRKHDIGIQVPQMVSSMTKRVPCLGIMATQYSIPKGTNPTDSEKQAKLDATQTSGDFSDIELRHKNILADFNDIAEWYILDKRLFEVMQEIILSKTDDWGKPQALDSERSNDQSDTKFLTSEENSEPNQTTDENEENNPIAEESGEQKDIVKESGGEQSDIMEESGGEQSDIMEESGGEQSDIMEESGDEHSDIMEESGGEQSDIMEESGCEGRNIAKESGGERSATVEESGGEQIDAVEDSEGEQKATAEESGGEGTATVEESEGERRAAVEESGGERRATVEESGGEQIDAVEDSEGERRATVEESGGERRAAVEESGGEWGATVEESGGEQSDVN